MGVKRIHWCWWRNWTDRALLVFQLHFIWFFRSVSSLRMWRVVCVSKVYNNMLYLPGSQLRRGPLPSGGPVLRSLLTFEWSRVSIAESAEALPWNHAGVIQHGPRNGKSGVGRCHRTCVLFWMWSCTGAPFVWRSARFWIASVLLRDRVKCW